MPQLIISDNDNRAVEPRLVFELPPKLMKTAIHNRTGKMAVLRHAAHVQVLNPNAPVGFHQMRRHLVGRIPPDVGNPRMEPGEPLPCLDRIAGAALLAREGPACSPQPFKQGRMRLRTVDRCAIRQHGQLVNAEVNTDRFLRLYDRLNVRRLHHD